MHVSKKALLAVIGAVLLAGVMSQDAYAQKRQTTTAERRLRSGTGLWENDSASRRMRHARDYANGLFDYSRRARTVVPSYATNEAAEIDRNVQQARKSLESVLKANSEDKKVLATLDSIEKHLAATLKHHEEFCAECAKAEGDSAQMMSCCNEMLTELDKAIAEHQALMRGIMITAEPNKAEPPTDQ